jgi:flagellar hook protein FlgE
VAANRLQRVDQQGPLLQSVSSTDVAISGNGFFPIKINGDDSALDEYLYTRNGQFSEDAQGNLRNAAGFYLYGWQLDSDGQLPAAQGDLSSLVPVDVAFLGGLTRPTGTVELSINLNADEDNSQVSTVTDLAVATSVPNFSRGVRVYDSLGSAQDITMQFTKVYGPMATGISTAFSLELDTSLTSTTVGMTAADELDFTAGGNPGATFVVGTDGDTIGDLIDWINAYSGGGVTEAFLNNNGELVVQAIDFTASDTITLTDGAVGTPASDLGFTTGVAYAAPDLPATPNGAVGDANGPYSNGIFPPPENLPGASAYNSRGWWQVNVVAPDGAFLTQGMINFNGDGSINALPDTDGEIDISLTAENSAEIDWGNGSEPQDIEIDIERFSQFAGEYNVIFSDQDGAELGLRTGVAIDEDGFVIARFSNGASTRLYKVPMVTFANPNGLQEISGTAYSETEESGEENLREAGRGGAGTVETSVLENSNVDLADEFSRLIIAQRAYSAGTKVINTVDQMTEELLRLR